MYLKNAHEYDKLSLKIKPRFNLSVTIEFPIYIYINENKYSYYFTYKITRHKKYDPYAIFLVKCDERYSYSYLFKNNYKWDGDSIAFFNNYCVFELDNKFTLQNIQNIKIRFGRHKIIKAKIE